MAAKTVSSTSDDPTRMLRQILVQRFSQAQCRFVQETNVGHFTVRILPKSDLRARGK